MLVHINYAGTVSDEFQIGKSGPTILQGTTEPRNSDGVAGDVYVKTGLEARVFVKQGSAWMASGDVSFGFVRDIVPFGDTATISSAVTYVGVVESQEDSTTTIVLPTGTYGKRIIIKDETGRASVFPIVVETSNLEKIDDAATYVIDRNDGAVILVFETDWCVIGSF